MPQKCWVAEAHPPTTEKMFWFVPAACKIPAQALQTRQDDKGLAKAVFITFPFSTAIWLPKAHLQGPPEMRGNV